MDGNSGRFTAPVRGYYTFSFKGNKGHHQDAIVDMYINGARRFYDSVGSGHIWSNIIELKKGDYIYYKIREDTLFNIYFDGQLLAQT